MLTNCKNCGAPLHRGYCEYCGTDYREPNQIYFEIPKIYKRTQGQWVETSLSDAFAFSTAYSHIAWDYYEKHYNKPTPIKTVRTN